MSFMDVDVVDFLERLGVNNVKDSPYGDEVAYSCPFDGHSQGDSVPSATMHKGSTGFFCFGCGRKGNAINFLSEMEGIPYHRAKRYINEEYSKPQRVDGSAEEAVRKVLDAPKRRVNMILSEREIESRRVDWVSAEEALIAGELSSGPLAYMLDERGFHSSTLERWEVGFDTVSNSYITVPYRNVRGELVGFKGRTWIKDKLPRYRVLGGESYGFDPVEVGKHVFGLHRITPSPEPMVVTEGEFNAMMVNQVGEDRVTGFSGQFLTEEQVGLIASRCGEAILVFDDMEKALRAARQLAMKIRVRVAPKHDKDPCELKNDVLELIRDAAVFDMMTSERIVKEGGTQ